MRVVHVITGLATGGAEVMLRKLLASMDRNRYESYVISLVPGGRLAAEIAELGVPVIELGMKRGVPTPMAFYRLFRAVRRIRPQVIQGWMYHGNFAAWLGWWMGGREAGLYWNIRQSLYDLSREKLGTRAVIRFCARHASGVNRILYNSITARRQHEAFGYPPHWGMTIPNGFETDVFRPDPTAPIRLRGLLGVGSETFLIGLVARLHPMKDHQNFLQAAALLYSRHPQARFVLVGNGVDLKNDALRSQIGQLGLRESVFLLGERSDVPELTAGLDVATSSSNSEAFPNAIGEAMACGVPCVVTDVGDSADIVGDTGLVVPAVDPEALATAWAAMIEMGVEKRRVLGEAARRRVEERYGLSAIARAYEDLYASNTTTRA